MDAPVSPTNDPARAAELRLLPARRALFAVLVAVTFATLLWAMARILGGDGFGAVDATLLCCFAAMLPWNVIGFWNALIGFTILFASRNAPALVLPALRSAPAKSVRSRLAVVMPVYDEEPERSDSSPRRDGEQPSGDRRNRNLFGVLAERYAKIPPALRPNQPPSPPGSDGRGMAFAPSTAAEPTITGTRPATFGTSLSGVDATSTSCWCSTPTA